MRDLFELGAIAGQLGPDTQAMLLQSEDRLRPDLPVKVQLHCETTIRPCRPEAFQRRIWSTIWRFGVVLLQAALAGIATDTPELRTANAQLTGLRTFLEATEGRVHVG